MLGNGNIRTLHDCQALMEATGVDGVMSAESLLADPALFSQRRLQVRRGCRGAFACSRCGWLFSCGAMGSNNGLIASQPLSYSPCLPAPTNLPPPAAGRRIWSPGRLPPAAGVPGPGGPVPHTLAHGQGPCIPAAGCAARLVGGRSWAGFSAAHRYSQQLLLGYAPLARVRHVTHQHTAHPTVFTAPPRSPSPCLPCQAPG